MKKKMSRWDKVFANQFETRRCAAIILEALHKGEMPDIKHFRVVHQRLAYRLLMFEGVISKKNRFEITRYGLKRIAIDGYNLYKPIRKPQETED